jgi:hypothetical protein
MDIKLAWALAGVAVGVVVTLVVESAVEPEAEPLRAPPPDPTEVSRLAELERENEALREDAAKLRQEGIVLRDELANKKRQLEEAVRPADTGRAEESTKELRPPTDEEIEAEIKAFGQALGQIIQGGGEQAKQRLRAFLARGGKAVIAKLADKFKDESAAIGVRVVSAHALAQSGDPDALEELKNTLRDPDAGMLMHRFASHGLAFSDAEGLETILTVTTRPAQDLGARANAAFGLARRGTEEGIPLYMEITDEAIENGDPAGLQYLGGITLLGEKAFPAMRERLLVYKEPQALLLLIEVLKSKGDKGAIPNLEKLAYDASRPIAVQRSAEAAIKALEESAK